MNMHCHICCTSRHRRYTLQRLSVLAFFITVIVVVGRLWLLDETEPVRVIVVEEHHEALRYWFHAAQRKFIRRVGNTLIHIDGHSDLAQPLFFEGYPAFSSLRSEEDVDAMTQRNDVFIQAAVMAGLISRVVWVFPVWDKTTDVDYYKYQLQMGWRRGQGGKRLNVTSFCECEVPLDPSVRDKVVPVGETTCSFRDPDLADQDVALPTEECEIVTGCIVEQVVDRTALEKMEAGDWIQEWERVILDIDEDFYGCESGVRPLLEAGVRWETVALLNGKISKFLCPRSSMMEKTADVFMKDLIAGAFKKCNWPDTSAATCIESIDSIVGETKSVVVDKIRHEDALLCGKTPEAVIRSWAEVLTVLHSLSRNQLQELLKIGFCLNVSPLTLEFDSIAEFKVCHGVNIPNETMVYLHTPTEAEVSHRQDYLVDLLDLLQKHEPRLVTLCRSVRDGFTPKKQAMEIERGIISYFKNHRGTHKPYSVLYDGNLMGGELGLEARHLPVV